MVSMRLYVSPSLLKNYARGLASASVCVDIKTGEMFLFQKKVRFSPIRKETELLEYLSTQRKVGIFL